MARILIPLDTRARLDSANPPTDRPPGTLVTALDVGSRWWGPRLGGKSFSNPHNMPSGDEPRGQSVTTFDGAGAYVTGAFQSPEQRDLGTRWTLDIVFSADSVNHATFDEAIIFKWTTKTSATAIDAITVGIRGTSAGGSERTIRATITPTSSPDVAGTTKTLDSTTQLTVGTDEQDRHHIRLVRDARTARLYVNGASEATAGGMSKSNGHVGSADVGQWELSSGAAPNFKGIVYYATLRDGVYGNPERGYPMPVFPRADAFRVAIDGMAQGTATVPDHSLYRAHGTPLNVGATSAPDQHPYPTPVQGMASFTDIKGRAWNVVVCGGMVYYRKVSR